MPVKAGDDYYIALAEHANGTERGFSWCSTADRTFKMYDVGGAITGHRRGVRGGWARTARC
ncbi:MAG: hypothetical protein FJX76_10855 [Armatimonadetes bacterium]|nr:hypothetical protein [Armatimonadota bacterium]